MSGYDKKKQETKARKKGKSARICQSQTTRKEIATQFRIKSSFSAFKPTDNSVQEKVGGYREKENVQRNRRKCRRFLCQKFSRENFSSSTVVSHCITKQRKKIVPEIEISLTIFFQGIRFASSGQKNL
jgi:hypothetical protein